MPDTSPMAQLLRPPSALETFAKKLKKAAPKGLPAPLAKFYAAGDGLTVDLGKHGKHSIVGLEAMFDRDFKPHKPVKKAPGDLLGRPFYERFFADDPQVDEPAQLARFNIALRLKLLVDLEGSSDSLGVDLFDGPKPVLYFVERAFDVFRLNLSFDEFVKYFTQFGSLRWYFAFLEERAGEAMNVDISAEVERSLEGFPASALTVIRKQVAKREKQVEKWRNAQDAKSGLGKATHKAFAQLKKERATVRGSAPDTEFLMASVIKRRLPIEYLWAFDVAMRELPEAMVPELLQAPRLASQDQLWPRVDHLYQAKLPEGVKVDAFMQDVLDVYAVSRGEKVKVSPRVKAALGEWLYVIPSYLEPKGLQPIGTLPEHPMEEAAASLRWHAGRLLALGSAMVGEAELMKIIHERLRRDLVPGSKERRRCDGATLVLGAAAIEPSMLGLLDHGNRGPQGAYEAVAASLEIARANKWSKAQIEAVLQTWPRGQNAAESRTAHVLKYLV
jgi:hypothetical protein